MSGEFHISRGSNAIAASIVVATIAAKASAAEPGNIVMMAPSWISATRMPTTKTSTIDQRPTNSVIRYSRVFCGNTSVLRRWTEIQSHPRISILPIGTKTLATKITSAIGYEPCCHRVTTPPKIVFSVVRPRNVVCMMGRKLAGM